MAYIEVIKWDNKEPLSETLIRSKFIPNANFRISQNTYVGPASFPVARREGLLFVVNGTCTYENPNVNVTFTSGTYARLPEGEYEFKIIDTHRVEIISVWDLNFITSEKAR